MTYGHLIGEVIRRITGQRLGEFFAAQIAGPLGANFHIGLPPSEFHRIANVVPPPAHPDDLTQLEQSSVEFKTKSGPAIKAEWSWTERWRRADIGAANGHGNARSVACLQSAVACGGDVNSVKLLSPRTIDRIFEVQSHTVDLVMGIPLKFGIGYGLIPTPQVLPFLPEGRLCAWGGWGGSLVIADADRRLTIAYVMNKMAMGSPGPIVTALVKRLYHIVNC